MYEAILDDKVFRVSSPAVAEMSKMLENSYRNVNIGLINEFAVFCNEIGIDIWEVIDAAKTKPFGFTPFYRSGTGRPLHTCRSLLSELQGECIQFPLFYDRGFNGNQRQYARILRETY